MSFYNTYRPKTFDQMSSAQVRTVLASLLTKKKGKLPHAFLLVGPKGIGKTTTARLIAKFFNCTTPKKNGEPCGECHLCTSIGAGRALDVLEIDAASHTGVDNIRDIKEKILLAPSIGSWKVYIIDEVHMLSTGAFNALLKTIEEPPANTVFILATTDPQKVPETITSRCQILPFQKPDPTEIISALQLIATTEGLAVENDALSLMATAADGSFRDATKYLEQASLTGGKITKEIVSTMLALAQESDVTPFLEALRQKQAAQLIAHIEKLKDHGVDIRNFFLVLLKRLQNLLVAQITTSEPSSWNLEELRTCLSILLTASGTVRGSISPDLGLELAVLEYCMNSQQQMHIPQSSLQQTPARVPVPSTRTHTLPPTPLPPQVPKAHSDQMLTPTGTLTKEQLESHWTDLIDDLKPLNHSIAGVLRSTRPESVKNDIVTIVAFYPFHRDKLGEAKSKEGISHSIKKLFGANVKVEVMLGKK